MLDVELAVLFQITDAKDIDFKSEIIRIYDKLNKDKQLTLYKVAKSLE
ncbi:MAG: hypothetical protein ACLSA2_08900 [Candidatus Gastranaerophilaceae bacterium]